MVLTTIIVLSINYHLIFNFSSLSPPCPNNSPDEFGKQKVAMLKNLYLIFVLTNIMLESSDAWVLDARIAKESVNAGSMIRVKQGYRLLPPV